VFKSVTTITELEQLQLRLAERELEVDELKQENHDQRSRYVHIWQRCQLVTLHAVLMCNLEECPPNARVQPLLCQACAQRLQLKLHIGKSSRHRAALLWTRSHSPFEHVLTSCAPAPRDVCVRLTCSMELTTKRLQEEVAYEQELRRQLADQLEQQASKVTRLQGAVTQLHWDCAQLYYG
jgi:TolA-binding protein